MFAFTRVDDGQAYHIRHNSSAACCRGTGPAAKIFSAVVNFTAEKYRWNRSPMQAHESCHPPGPV
jgi:hypothetical protein